MWISELLDSIDRHELDNEIKRLLRKWSKQFPSPRSEKDAGNSTCSPEIPASEIEPKRAENGSPRVLINPKSDKTEFTKTEDKRVKTDGPELDFRRSFRFARR